MKSFPWFADPQWFSRLAAEGGLTHAPNSQGLSHGDAARLPLVQGPHAGHWQGLSNYYTPLLEPVSGEPLVDATGLVRCWHQAGVGVLDLRPLDGPSPWVLNLTEGLQAAGFWISEVPAFGNWVLDVNGQSAAGYLAGRPGPLRTSLQRGRARLTRAGEWGMAVVTDPGEALERALTDYQQVYARSWKPTEGAPGFIRSLARWMAGRGQLRLGVLRLNGEPLAAQLWFVEHGIAYIFKLAHVEGREALSPGTVLTAHLMTHVIDVDKVHTVDFISGDDAYKRDWMSRRRQRIALLAFNPRTWAGLKAGLRHFGGRWWRNWAQRPRRN